MTVRAFLSFALLPLLALTACGGPVEPEPLRVEVIERYPHDTGAFTQGLVWNGSTLYESTGLLGRSSLREVELASGEVIRSLALDDALFGEGLTLFGDELIQLTFRSSIALVYDAATFNHIDTHGYVGEGWGLTQDGTRLIMTTGGTALQFRDPGTFDLLSSVVVTANGTAVDDVNELEYVDGYVYANVWTEDLILKIDPDTGVVVAEIDASGLLTPVEAASANVLNGIAYLPDSGHFLITGKLWPWVFEVRFVPADENPTHGMALGGAPGDQQRN
jgi:glutaminyl-peptide cyclotransferase